MKQKTGRKLLSFLLTLVMVVGLIPGMSLTAYAAQETLLTTITATGTTTYSESVDGVVNVTLSGIRRYSNGWAYGGTVTVEPMEGYTITKCRFNTRRGLVDDNEAPFSIDVSSYTYVSSIEVYGYAESATVAVTSVTLNPSTAQTIDVDGKVSFTATVEPNDATDKTVKWSVTGDAVTLYSDADCTAGNEVGADATETLTVYAKGISAGSATVTATSNADSNKSASCEVTVNEAQTQTETLLTTITATGKEQANYSTANVATVSFSYTAGGSSEYLANWGWWGYGWTATVTPADGYAITKCVFYDDANRKATDSEAPFVVETTEEDKTPQVNGTPILAYTSKGITKIEVYGYATPAPALDPVSYMAWNGTTLVEKTGDDACTDYTVVTADTTTFEDGKWYVVSNSVTVSNRITVTGTANLILRDGATLTASKGITVNSGNTINIYAQIGGTGELNAGSDTNVASIGGGARYQSSGTVNIHGGKITATGGSTASGIGGALDGGNGEVNIYGGNVTARGQNAAAGIGGYTGKSGGTVNIYGGTVNASGSQSGTTGIGIGGNNPGNCVVHIYGGEVTATSEKAAAGIQGTITIDGGTVTAKGGGESYTIDCYSGETYSSNGINGTVTVNGGTVTATGGNVTVTGGYAGAIESYGGTTYACSGINGTVTISGGTVTATGGNVTGDINNYGGTIYACNGVNGTVTISGGTVTATGGSHTGNSSGTTVKEKGFGGSLTLGTGMYLYGGTSANPESDLSNYRAGAGDYTGDRYVYMTVNNVVPHIHSFTYTADGATVTATCGAEGCDLTSNPTLTIVAPTLTTYGQTGEGISEKATLDGLDAFNSATDLTVAASDIKYYGVEEYEIEGHTYKKQGDELAQVPTAAGEYVAGLTLSNVKTSETETGDVIARVWYTIAPASISSVTVTDITAPVATEALDTEAATSTANVTLGAVTWNPTTTPAAYATQYTATVIATAAANYAFADTVTATVNGQAATVTKNDGGTLTIAYTFEKTALTPVTITATDKKADWSADGIAIPVEGMFTITEGAGAATYTVTNGTGEGTYDAQTGKLTVTKCGTFTVKVSTAATDTYAAGAETTATLTVNKVDSTAATVTANTLIYTGSAQALVTVTGEATGGTMQYALGTKDAATEEYTPSIPTGTDAGTYYVWCKAVGDETHTDSEAKCITVTISSESSGGSGGSSSSGGGSSTPSTPTTPTESYTVPVSSENTVNVTTNISNGTAVVSEITQSDIDKIVDNGNNSGGGDNTGASENTSITIDVSQAKSEVTSVQLSEKTVEKLTEAVKADNNVESVKIKMTNATIELDGAALSAVSEQAEGSSIKLVVEDTQTTKLNATQQESLKQFASAKPFQAYFESNGKEIHDFKGGKATVSIKFSPESGRDVKHYHMYYLPVAGAIERYVTRYVDGMLSFVTTHFSDYAIVYDETRENETGKEDEADNTDTDDNNGTDAGKTTEETSETTANGKTAYQNALSINKGLKVSQIGNKITVSWGKVSGANRYEIYVAYCTGKFGKTPVKVVTKKGVTSVTITKLNGKKLELTKNFKVYVAAYKTVDGVKKKLGKTITAHIVGRKNKTYTNVKAIKLAKNKTTIKVGKTYKIKASVVLVDSKKKMLSDKHAATFRYASSNKKIAAVDKNGKVTAKKKGTCYVWIYAKNGYAKKVKVTVK